LKAESFPSRKKFQRFNWLVNPAVFSDSKEGFNLSNTFIQKRGECMSDQILDPSKVVSALAPAFAAGFAVQQTIELVDTFFSATSKAWRNLADAPAAKKLIASGIGLLLSIVLVTAGKLDIITPLLTQGAQVPGFVRNLISVIFISAGTEGFNSLLKWVSWKKEESKAKAAGKPSQAAVAAVGK